MSAERVERRLAAIMSADVVGYSRLMAADETGTLERFEAQRKGLIEPKIFDHHGRIVKLMGDGVLAEFASVVDAVQGAVEIQRAMADLNRDISREQRIELRIGINLGDVIVREDDIHGDGVNVAARLEQLSEPAGIIISGTAFDHAKNKVEVGFEDLGPQTVKNIPEPVRAYRVLLEPGAAGKVVGQKEARKRLLKRWRWAIPAAAAVVVIGVAAGVLLSLEPWVERVEAAVEAEMAFPLPEEPSIVVLPFENVGGDREQDYFADGVTGDLIAHLATSPDLFVIDRTSSFSYKGKPTTVKQVAEELGVRFVLQGSVQRSGDKLRIAAEFIDALSGRRQWSERYDRDVNDLLILQSEITKNISVALDVGFRGDFAKESCPSDTLQIWELCKKAGYHLDRFTPQDSAKAKALFLEAIDMVGEHPTLVASLASLHFFDVQFGLGDDPDASFALAKRFAERAIELDESNASAHLTLSYVAGREGHQEQAIAHAREAVRLSPGNAVPNGVLASLLIDLGPSEEARDLIDKAMRLDPFAQWQLIWLADIQLTSGDFASAVETLQTMVERQIGFFPGMAQLLLAITYGRMGRMDNAATSLAAFLNAQPDYSLDEVRNFSSFKAPEIRERRIAVLRELGLPEHPPLPLPDKPSIAVLPFDNLSDDPEQEWFADGMTDDLITDLSKISSLFVIARNSSFTYKGKAVDVKNVGRELGVKYVLEGSVRRAGDQVRINAQLVDATTGRHLWAERFDDTMGNIFALQDRVTRRIVSELDVTLSTSEEQQIILEETSNVAAYEAFLRGWEHFRRFTPKDLAVARDYLEKAVELDSSYGRAYAALALVHHRAFEIGWSRRALGMGDQVAQLRSGKYLRRALETPTPLAHRAASEIYLRVQRTDEALEEARRALTLDPNDPENQVAVAKTLIFLGREEEAVGFIKAAIRLETHYPAEYLHLLGLARFGMEQFEEAVSEFQEALARNPAYYRTYAPLAATLVYLQRGNDALLAFEKYWEGESDAGGWPMKQDLGLRQRWPYKHQTDWDRLKYGLTEASGRDFPVIKTPSYEPLGDPVAPSRE